MRRRGFVGGSASKSGETVAPAEPDAPGPSGTAGTLDTAGAGASAAWMDARPHLLVSGELLAAGGVRPGHDAR